MFMTSGNGGYRHKAMLAHQDLFARFLSAKSRQDVRLWNNWGADNGAFTGFDQDLFMGNLRQLLPYKATCRFVVVPDVPFHWEPTLIKFADWAPSIRRMGFPIALAVQDGATVNNVPWSEIDALFIGGSTEWKRQQWRHVNADLPLFTGLPDCVERPTQVAELVNEARSRGMWVHIGRSANAPQQLWYAYNLGADSVDGTGEHFKPDQNFKWIAQTMWEIRQHEQRKSQSLQPGHDATLAGKAQRRSGVEREEARMGQSRIPSQPGENLKPEEALLSATLGVYQSATA